jgi:hypothetical protein
MLVSPGRSRSLRLSRLVRFSLCLDRVRPKDMAAGTQPTEPADTGDDPTAKPPEDTRGATPF